MAKKNDGQTSDGSKGKCWDNMPYIDTLEIKEAPYITGHRTEFSIGKDEGTD